MIISRVTWITNWGPFHKKQVSQVEHPAQTANTMEKQDYCKGSNEIQEEQHPVCLWINGDDLERPGHKRRKIEKETKEKEKG